MKKKILVLLTLMLIIPINTNAKTLGEYKKELNQKEIEYSNKNNDIKQNEQEQTATKNRIPATATASTLTRTHAVRITTISLLWRIRI